MILVAFFAAIAPFAVLRAAIAVIEFDYQLELIGEAYG